MSTVSSFDPDDYEDYPPENEDADCTICGGDGWQECTDPIQCMAPNHIGIPEDPLCPCIGCRGSGLARDQTIW